MVNYSSELNVLLQFLPTNFEGKQILQLNIDESSHKTLSSLGAKSVTTLDSSVENIFNENNFNENNFDLIYGISVFDEIDNQKFIDIIGGFLNVLKVGGFLILRETFQGLNGEKKSPINFIDLIQSKVIENKGVLHGFDLVFAKPEKSVKNEQKENNVAFLLTKIQLENHHGFKTLKEFMDQKQYSRNGVLIYEKIFGFGFVSTGGIETTKSFLKDLNLEPNQRVLDVGCGIGGGDFLMAEKYGVEVIGVDLSSNMIGISWERAESFRNLNVKFEIGDVTKNTFPSNYFDVIYSRDTILHIADKKSLFSQFKDWLKPGGKIFITDYCCGAKPWSVEYTDYVEQRGYNLLTVQEYGKLFTELGFLNVKATDVTDMFVDCLNFEIKKFYENKQDFLNQFTQEDFNYIIDGWKAKLIRCSEGHQRWGKFYCEK